MASISGQEQNLFKIFNTDYDFYIPEYQRPYSWTTVQAEELFEDLRTFFERAEDEPYFLGSIVLIKAEGSRKADVIDGQQRLTTLSLLFAALANQAEGQLKQDLEGALR